MKLEKLNDAMFQELDLSHAKAIRGGDDPTTTFGTTSTTNITGHTGGGPDTDDGTTQESE